jgi:PAS domain-containing protein
MEGAPHACLLTDDRGMIRDANAAAARLLDRPPAMLVAKPLGVFVPAKPAGRVPRRARADWRAAAGGRAGAACAGWSPPYGRRCWTAAGWRRPWRSCSPASGATPARGSTWVGSATTCARARFGLVGMRQRVEMLGGTWRVRSEPGRGTAVTVRLPLPER